MTDSNSDRNVVLQWRSSAAGDKWHEFATTSEFAPNLSFTTALHGDRIEVRVKPERKPEYWRSKSSGHIYKDDNCGESDNFEPVEVEVKPWKP